jgi:excisionase family DNA binding protein
MAARTQTVTAYSLTEAAKRLGVTRQTLWRAVRDGKLEAHKSGNAVIVFSDALLDYVLRYRGGKGIPEA